MRYMKNMILKIIIFSGLTDKLYCDNIAQYDFRQSLNGAFLEGLDLKIALTIAFIIVAVALTIIVLSQEGKDNGFGSAMTGTVDTYWSKNKKHSKDAVIKKVTAVLGVLFMVVAILLGSKWFR